MPPLEAGLAVTLHVAQGAVADLTLHSTRLVQASRLLAGRPPAQVTAILPTIYALCGTAQALAGCTAMEAALDLAPDHSHRVARSILLRLELVSEHTQGILRDWPALLGEAPDLSAVKPLRPLLAAAKRALYPDGDWARLGGGRLEIDHGALTKLLTQLTTLTAPLFSDSPDNSIAARLQDRIERLGLSDFGRAPLHPMPDSGPHDLEARLEADRDGGYVARPDCAGVVLETNALSRRYGHPQVADLMARHGGGLTPRLTARLVEIAAALQDLEELVQDLGDASGDGSAPRSGGCGLGTVDAARGLLAHRVEIEEGMVSRYQILAPTEWNFHPQGPLRAGLLGAEAGPDLEWRARLLIAALDPCVACTIEIRHA